MLAVTQGALERVPDAAGVDSGPEALAPTDRSAWLPTEVGLSDVVIPAARAEVDRRRAAASCVPASTRAWAWTG